MQSSVASLATTIIDHSSNTNNTRLLIVILILIQRKVQYSISNRLLILDYKCVKLATEQAVACSSRPM